MKRLVCSLTLSGLVLAAFGCTANLETACVQGACEPQPDAGNANTTCAPPATGDFPMNIGAVIANKCQSCHTNPPVMGAPMPLLRYEDIVVDLAGSGKPVYEYMIINVSTGFMPFMPAPKLTTDEKKLLLGWLQACPAPVPQGTGADKD